MYGLLFLTLALVAAPSGAATTPPAVEFVDAVRSSSGTFFLTRAGYIYVFRSPATLEKMFTLRGDRDLPLRWPNGIAGFTLWRSNWIVADGSANLRCFSSEGRYLHTITLPQRVIKIISTQHRLWALNPFAHSPAEQLWSSADASTSRNSKKAETPPAFIRSPRTYPY
jgi:hypothetical protein